MKPHTLLSALTLFVTCLMSFFSLSIETLNNSTAQIKINVGSGIRPPFLTETNTIGAAPEVIRALNVVQNKYKFELIAVPIKRRMQALDAGWVDIIMWDNPLWGWKTGQFETSVALVHSKDIFLSLSNNNTRQDYFYDFKNKSLAGVNGYHYQFIKDLKESDNVSLSLVRTEEDSIKMLLEHRVDIAVASNIALNWFLINNPQFNGRFTRSQRVDSAYSRYFLIPKSSLVSAEEINAMLVKADELELLTDIYQRYGLNKPEFK